MKLIRILIVAAVDSLVQSSNTPERTDHKSDDTGPAAATSGETGQPAVTPEPATQPNQGEKPAAPTPVAEQAKATGVNPDAAVLADFKSRIDAYMKLRKEAVKDAPRLKETKDPAKIRAAQDAMSIRFARHVRMRHTATSSPRKSPRSFAVCCLLS